jgi:hypothetical protein
MKPTTKQKFVCTLIEEQVYTWNLTNDIKSDTLMSEMELDISNAILFNSITEEQGKQLQEKLTDLYYFVRNLT